MIVLAVDTSASTATAAITENGAPVAQSSFHGAKTHSETLLPMISDLMALSHLTADDIDLFACCTGPGSFTGIRIGVSVIKGLAFGKNKPCISLSSTDVLAYPYLSLPHVTVCPVLDARRSTYYNALYRDGKKVTEDRLLSSDELLSELKNESDPVLLCGDGAPVLYEAWKDELRLIHHLPTHAYPAPYATPLCAQMQHERGENIRTDTTLIPVYLRPTQAERELDATTKEQ